MQRQVSFKMEPEEDGDMEDNDKKLTEFREGGGRYFLSEERRNHFEIKHWCVFMGLKGWLKCMMLLCLLLCRAMEILNLFFNFQLYKGLHVSLL